MLSIACPNTKFAGGFLHCNLKMIFSEVFGERMVESPERRKKYFYCKIISFLNSCNFLSKNVKVQVKCFL